MDLGTATLLSVCLPEDNFLFFLGATMRTLEGGSSSPRWPPFLRASGRGFMAPLFLSSQKTWPKFRPFCRKISPGRLYGLIRFNPFFFLWINFSLLSDDDELFQAHRFFYQGIQDFSYSRLFSRIQMSCGETSLSVRLIGLVDY